ncbi:hypothetical protein ACJX0J_037559, partial [Zea mays]
NHLPLAHLSIESTRHETSMLLCGLNFQLAHAYHQYYFFNTLKRAQLAYKLSNEQCHFIFMLGKYL